MPYSDLRGWLAQVEDLGELRKLDGADWNLEIGALVTLARQQAGHNLAMLFDHIKDYPPGYRVLVGMLNSPRTLALVAGTPIDAQGMDFVREWRRRIGLLKPLPPTLVKDGPILENVHLGKEVNLLEFPAPHWHELDGGRYIGTGCVVITKDPETGWVNLGTYRGMVHDGQSMGFFLEQDRHASIHRQKYWEAGKPCPVAISFGHDPLLFLVACQTIPYGFSEYDYAGGIRGEPIEVIEGQVTGLPIPACSEIVIEGESLPDDARAEGPFAEWTGYYGRQAEPTPIIRVKAVYHRRDPILCGRPTNSSFMSLMKSARVWDQLEAAGVPGVQGVWCEPKTRGYLWMVVSIKQRYPGHAKQAALVASQCGAAKDMGRFVIVVDDDVDPSNLTEVLWAMCTRADPERSIDIVRRCCGGYLDTANRQGERGFTSHAIIDACRPYEWLGDFPPMVEVSPALKERVMQKWGELVFP